MPDDFPLETVSHILTVWLRIHAHDNRSLKIEESLTRMHHYKVF
jgi:hypothetical protein